MYFHIIWHWPTLEFLFPQTPGLNDTVTFPSVGKWTPFSHLVEGCGTPRPGGGAVLVAAAARGSGTATGTTGTTAATRRLEAAAASLGVAAAATAGTRVARHQQARGAGARRRRRGGPGIPPAGSPGGRSPAHRRGGMELRSERLPRACSARPVRGPPGTEPAAGPTPPLSRPAGRVLRVPQPCCFPADVERRFVVRRPPLLFALPFMLFHGELNVHKGQLFIK